MWAPSFRQATSSGCMRFRQSRRWASSRQSLWSAPAPACWEKRFRACLPPWPSTVAGIWVSTGKWSRMSRCCAAMPPGRLPIYPRTPSRAWPRAGPSAPAPICPGAFGCRTKPSGCVIWSRRPASCAPSSPHVRGSMAPSASRSAPAERFKEINDSHGQAAGDDLLREVARRLQNVLRDSDTVARLGGDEFAVLLPSTQEVGAAVVAGKIVSALRDPFVINGTSVEMNGSIGIGLYPDHGEESAMLLQAADAAMYVAKRRKSGYAVH